MRILSNIVDFVATPYTIYFILKDAAISRSVKLRAVIVMALIIGYVISSIDIIPDFIPFAGWMDDLIVVPLGLALLRKITPGIDVVEKRNRARTSARGILVRLALLLAAAILLALLWLGLIIYAVVRLFTR